MDIKKLIEILFELRSESMNLNSNQSENAFKTLAQKYNMFFIGEKFSTINSMELCNVLKNYFHLETNNDELNSLLPDACKCLNMKYEPLVKLGKAGKTLIPDCYSIILW